MLLVAALGWGISAIGIFLPWPLVVNQLQYLGAEIPNDPMLNYWFRMTACGFTFIACTFIYMSINPQKNLRLIQIAGYFKIFLGVLLLIYGVMLNLFIIPYIVDSCFCLLIGIILVSSCWKIKKYK